MGVRFPVVLKAEALSQLVTEVMELKEGKWVKMSKNCVAKSDLNVLK